MAHFVNTAAASTKRVLLLNAFMALKQTRLFLTLAVLLLYAFNNVLGQTTYSTATSSCSAAGNSWNIIQTVSGGQRFFARYSNADFGGGLPSSVLINQLGFDICTAANPSTYTFQNFTVQLREVASSNCFIGSGGTLVYSGNFTISGTGWQDITLDNIFTWSNTGNFLEVTICFSAPQTGTTAPAIRSFVGTSACRGRTSGALTNCSSSPTEGTLTSKSSIRLITPGPCAIPTNVTSLSGTGDNTIANLSWATPGCFNDEVLVVAQAGSPVVATPSGDGSAYTANLNFGSGTAFGSGFVVYKGLTSPQTITGLANGTTYYFKVFSRLGSNWSSGVEIQVTPFEYIQTAIQTTLSPTSHPFFNSAGTWEDFRFNSTYTQAQLGNPGTVDLSRIAWYVRSTAGSSPAGTYQNFNIKLKSTPTLGTSFQTGTTNYSIGTVEINPSTTSDGTWLEFVIDPPLTWNAGEFLYVETCYDNPNGSPVGNNSILVARTGVNYYYGRSAGGTNQTGCSQGFSTGSSATAVPALKIALAPSGCSEPTINATNFSSNSVGSSSGNVSFTRGDGDGGVLVVARSGGAVNADPDPGTSYTANSSFGSGDEIGTGNFVVYNGSAAGINTASGNIPISGLSAQTTYHFAIYEYNSAGTCYSTSPLVGSFITDCNTPVNITGLTATVDNQQSTISWTNSACYDEVMIVAKLGSSVSGTPTGNGSAYTDNLVFGNGTAFGGGNVMYKGSASSQTITGLTNGSTYFIKVFTRKGTTWSNGVEVSVVPIEYFQAGTITTNLGTPQTNPFFNSAGTLEDYRVGSWYTQAQFGINGTIKVDRIGWFIKQATGLVGNYQNFNIKLKSTSQACTGAFQTGTTTVSTSATVTINSSNPQEAWLEFVLATPFIWNAGDYLYVETCYDNPNGSPVGNNNIIVAGFATNTTGYVRSAGGQNITGCTQGVSTAICSGTNVPSLRIAGDVCTNNTWTSGASGDLINWFNDANWSCGIVPTSGVDVVIPTSPSGGSFFPIVNGLQSALVNNITIETSATITFSNASTLEVNGDFTNNGTANFETGELQMKGTNKILNGNFTLGVLNIQGNTAIDAGGQVNVLDKLELQSGQLNTNNKLTLKSSAAKTAFVDDFSSGFNGTVTGNLSIERYVPGSGNKFHYFGALTSGTASKWNDDYTITSNAADNTPVTLDPLKPCGPTALAVGSAYGNLLTYDETLVTNCFLAGWRVRNTSATTDRGRGFAGRVPSTTVLTETGTYAKTDVLLSGLSVTGANTDATSKGFHFVSNPFWAPILWSGVTGTNLYGTAYRYDPNTGSYGAYNNITAPMEISTNEAFFVRGNWATVNDGNSTFSINFPASARTTGENNTFLRSGLPYAYGVKITVNAHNTTDHTLIAFDNRFSTAHDNGYDALKLDNDFNVANIYTLDATAQRSAILALPENTATASVPLNIDIRYTDVHELTFDLQSFPATAMVFLEDKTTGVWHNLRINNSYSFNATAGDNSARFVLHFTPAAVFNATASGCENNTGIISIQQDGGITWDYEIKDEQNTTVYSGSNLTGYMEFVQLAAGNYTIALVHESGYTATENITVIATENISLTVNATANTIFVNEPVTVNAILSSNGTTNWDMGDGTVYNNTETVTHSYTGAGNYTVSATAANDNCNDTKTIDITVEENLVTGIAANNDKTLKVYASGNTVFVEQYVSKELVNADLTVYNTLGQIIQQEKISELNYGAKQQINVNASSGIYYLHVVLSNGTEVQTKFLINR